MFFVKNIKTGEVSSFETAHSVGMFMLGRVFRQYEMYVGSTKVDWPENGSLTEIVRALSEYEEV